MAHSPGNSTEEPRCEPAQDELVDRLRKSDPGAPWFYAIAVNQDGERIGYASDLFRAPTGIVAKDVVAFSCFDAYTRLIVWRLSHLWRACDLGDVAHSSLAQWGVLPAAACARALLEGVAAFVVEGENLLEEWNQFKQLGEPALETVQTIRSSFVSVLAQAQFGSRVPELREKQPRLQRTNILTLMDKFSKRGGGRVSEVYDWLCDAVHPSFGFGTAFVTTQGVHASGTLLAADIARRAHIAPTRIDKIEPTIAYAVADAICVSIDELLVEMPRVRWLIDDFGLTTRAAFGSRIPGIGLTSEPGRNDLCPCGSGRKFKSCGHRWGEAADPPTSNKA